MKWLLVGACLLLLSGCVKTVYVVSPKCVELEQIAEGSIDIHPAVIGARVKRINEKYMEVLK